MLVFTTVKCEHCNGSGHVKKWEDDGTIARECEDCGGTAYLPREVPWPVVYCQECWWIRYNTRDDLERREQMLAARRKK